MHAVVNAEVGAIEEQRRLQHGVDEKSVDQHEVTRLRKNNEKKIERGHAWCGKAKNKEATIEALKKFF